jgi:hypothetical protein
MFYDSIKHFNHLRRHRFDYEQVVLDLVDCPEELRHLVVWLFQLLLEWPA